MIIVGASLMAASQFIDQRLLSEGIAFIIVGLVGMLMSWTTFDIGTSIREAIHEVGRQNQRALDSLAESQKDIARMLERITKSQDDIAKSQDDIAKSQDDIKDILQNRD